MENLYLKIIVFYLFRNTVTMATNGNKTSSKTKTKLFKYK